jgi:hypothetical protein
MGGRVLSPFIGAEAEEGMRFGVDTVGDGGGH